MSNVALKPVHFRDTRPYLVAERLEYVENTSDMDAAEVLFHIYFTFEKLNKGLDSQNPVQMFKSGLPLLHLVHAISQDFKD